MCELTGPGTRPAAIASHPQREARVERGSEHAVGVGLGRSVRTCVVQRELRARPWAPWRRPQHSSRVRQYVAERKFAVPASGTVRRQRLTQQAHHT